MISFLALLFLEPVLPVREIDYEPPSTIFCVPSSLYTRVKKVEKRNPFFFIYSPIFYYVESLNF